MAQAGTEENRLELEAKIREVLSGDLNGRLAVAVERFGATLLGDEIIIPGTEEIIYTGPNDTTGIRTWQSITVRALAEFLDERGVTLPFNRQDALVLAQAHPTIDAAVQRAIVAGRA